MIEISPYVVVYKNQFKDIDKTYSFFKSIDEKSDLIFDFKYNDNSYGWATETYMFSSLYKDFNKKVGADCLTEIIKIRKDTMDSYVKKYADSNIWPLDILNIYPFEDPTLHSSFSVIKTFHNPEVFITRHPFFHLDNIPNPEGDFQRNHIITTMIYINDDYDHGEIKFYSKEKGFVYYKPQAGDVVIFPSFYPFYHNPNMPLGQNRYAIRSSYDEVCSNELLKNNSVKFQDYVDKEEYSKYNNNNLSVNYIYGKEIQ